MQFKKENVSYQAHANSNLFSIAIPVERHTILSARFVAVIVAGVVAHFVYDAGQPKGNESGIRAPTNSISGTDIVMAFGIFVVVAIVLFFGILMVLGMGNYFDTFG